MKTYSCPWCDIVTCHSRGLTQHINKIHHKSKEELFHYNNPNCRQTCVDCNVPVKLIDQEKGYAERCGKCNRKYSYSQNNRSSWNKGLTKSNDDRMLNSSKKMHEHYEKYGHHFLGKTKENNAEILAKAINKKCIT